MRRKGALLAVVVLAFGLGVEGADAGRPLEPHYPDLRTKPPSDFRIPPGGPRRLFFSNTVENRGPGPLELRAVNNATTGLTDAYQQVWTHNADGATQLFSEELVGTFAFHPSHNHWHFGNFARYQLRALNAQGGLGPVLRSTDKVSFCILETMVATPGVAHFGWGGSHSCGPNEDQGLKVGYGDVYSSALPDQFIDIAGVPDGIYWVSSIADPTSAERPAGRLVERREQNNRTSVKISIDGNTVTVIG